jgi:hypothetical protein
MVAFGVFYIGKELCLAYRDFVTGAFALLLCAYFSAMRMCYLSEP